MDPAATTFLLFGKFLNYENPSLGLHHHYHHHLVPMLHEYGLVQQYLQKALVLNFKPQANDASVSGCEIVKQKQIQNNR